MAAKKTNPEPNPRQLSYRTKEQNHDKHPQCDMCVHYTERVFSATEQTHWIELRGTVTAIYLCVRCWSELLREEDEDAA